MIDFSRLDKIIHERGRLSIMSLLAAQAHWSFQDIKSELKMSDGNLITHLRTLYDAGYISMSRHTTDSRPQTRYALTAGGRTAFKAYLAILEQIVARKPR